MLPAGLNGRLFTNQLPGKQVVALISYFLTFAEGVLTFVSPCILPMLPVYFIYLAGSPDDIGDKKGLNKRMLLNSLGFVAGFTIVFVLLGVTITSVGRLLDNNRVLLQKISGVIMMIFGLNFTGVLRIGFLNIEKRLDYKTANLKFLSSVLFGMVFAFGWTPCLGAFLGSALLLAGNSETLLKGTLLLLVYSIGLGIPFIISAIVIEKAMNVFKKIRKYSRLISIISGILLIAAGILVFTDNLKYLV